MKSPCLEILAVILAMVLPSLAEGLEYAISDFAPAGRLELREASSFGHALVTGIENQGAPDGGTATAWNTTALAEGWQTLVSGANSVSVCVRNDASVAVEGGRLPAAATEWNNARVHLVRNWVVVPNGGSLTITVGTVVKFCERSGIWVEAGGTVNVNGAEGADVFFAAAGNDAYGGNTNLREGDDPTNGYEVVTLNGGLWSDNGYWVTPDAKLRGYPEVSLHDAVASEAAGVVRIPVTVSGTRNAPFSADWKVTGGTASVGDDYTVASGTLSWTASSEGMKYIEIPLKQDTIIESLEKMEISIIRSRSCNVAVATCTATIYDHAMEATGFEYAISDFAPAGRLELRDASSFGHALVTGIETQGAPDGATVTAWNTTALAEGWQTLISGANSVSVCVRNDASVAVEGGRLPAAATEWNNARVHLVRNWVVVPNGGSLTITEGTVVKFCERAGIWVEAGGTVNVNGAEGADVFFAAAGNDAYGGNTNLREGDDPTNGYEVVTLNGGLWSDNGYWVTPDAKLRGYPEISLHDAVASEAAGVVRIPVTVSGTRNAPFSMDWEIEGGADDFEATSGTLSWTGTSEGNKIIELRIKTDALAEGIEAFSIAITRTRSANCAMEAATVRIYDPQLAVGDIIESGASEFGGSAFVDTVGVGETIVSDGSPKQIAYSTEWNDAESVSLAVTVPSGTEATLARGSAPVEGFANWTATEGVGRYTLTHTSGDETLSAAFVVLGENSIVIDGNRLQSNATWLSNHVYVVQEPLTVPSGVTLTIEPGAIVKFCAGASLTVASDGACVAKGVIFTHIADDTAGGDTLFDGDATKPAMGEYEISGTVTDDESTEYRYTAPVVTSGTITSNTRWRGWKLYHVTGNLTIASGKTLTLEPGCIVKFDSGRRLTVNSGATLLAQGTRAQPITFTSVKDDAVGGDTNGDGDATYPYAGDWARIECGGTVTMDHCRIWYASDTSDRGAIQGTGGTVTFDNGEIAHMVYECVRMNSGSFVSHNSVFRDSSMGFGYYGGSGTYVYNGVVEGCSSACRASNKHFFNTVFYRCPTFLESTSSSCSHCLFFNPAGFGAQTAVQVGSDGNLWGDPCFADPDDGDFTIAKDSPAIDAGEAGVAPETDYWGQPRNGAPDIGICEYQGTGALSPNDLQAVEVKAGTAVTAGGTLAVAWRTANVGTKTVSGSWRDKVELVDRSGANECELGLVLSGGPLAVGATNEMRGTFTVPADLEGDWYVRIRVNAERDIYEGIRNVSNNTATAADPVAIAMPTGSTAAGHSGSVPAGGMACVKFAVAGGEALIARIRAPAGTVVYFGNGFAPTAENYSAKAVADQSGAVIGIPAGTEAAYLAVASAGGAVAYGISFVSGALAVKAVSPTEIPYAGTTGLKVTGANFADGCGAEFLLGGIACAGAVTKTNVVSATQLSLTVDCAKLKAGATYGVRITTAGGESVVLENAVTVSPVPCKPELSASLDVPKTVRQGRTVTAYVDYENTGNADLPAPIFEIISEGQIFKIDGNFYTNSVKLVGLSSEAPVGTLRPGEAQRLAVQVTCMAPSVNWKLRSYHAAQEGAKRAFRLETVFSSKWVYEMAANTNSTLLVRMNARLGKTYADFYSGLAAFIGETLDEGRNAIAYSRIVADYLSSVYDEVKEIPAEESNGAAMAQACFQTAQARLAASIKPDIPGEWLEDVSYSKDNSNPGDVWWWRGSGWYKPKQDEMTMTFSETKSVFLICHGNANSIHEEWIENMAKDAVNSRKYAVVLAVDWGDDAHRHLAMNPEKNAVYIPNDAELAVTALRNLGVSGSCLTVCGHSHGGHFGGIVAKQMGARRLILMDASPIWTHENSSTRYPNAWDVRAADVVEFYKTSWDYSMGTDPTDSQNGGIPGNPNFFVTQEADFYIDAYKRGERKHVKYSRALDLHGYSHQWVRSNMAWLGDLDFLTDSGWSTLSGCSGARPDAGVFAGVLRERQMECGVQVRERVAGSLGVEMDAVDWRYENFILGRGNTSSQDAGMPKSPPDSLFELQRRMVQVSEHSIDSLSIEGTMDDGKLYAGENYRWRLAVDNYADNKSIDFNHTSLANVQKPWDLDFARAIAIADVTDADDSRISSVLASIGQSDRRLTWAEVEKLQNAGLRFKLVATDSCFKTPRTVWIPDTLEGNISQSALSGETEENGERRCLLISAVGICGSTLASEGRLASYPGELCRDNNCLARLVTVKPGKPTGIVTPGIATYKWSITQTSAFAPELVMDDNTYEADVNGGWSVKLTGAASEKGLTNIVSGSWTGVDCTASHDGYSDDPNVVMTGVLNSDGNGEPVPCQDYTVTLTVVDANGKTSTRDYTFTVHRKADEDPGTDEDAQGSASPKSCDPNAVEGPEGVGTARIVKPGDWLTYTIYFENKADADAAAASVTVMNPLDQWLDWSSLEMLDVGFGAQTDVGLSGLSSGTSEVTMDGTNTSVRTQFELDTASGTAIWYLRIVDPNGDTDGWPLDAYAGFLPPNDSTHRGEGHVSYRIRLCEDAPVDAVISNVATIVFDYNEPITTDPAWWNTVGSLGAAFDSESIAVDEGETIELTISGGNAEKATSAQVYLAYQTAAAADIDLKTAKVDGVTPKGGIKFPLTLNWAAGVVTNHVISIPVKADKTVEDDETLVFQLAAAQGMEIGETATCAVTIRDANVAVDYAAKQAKETVKVKKGVETNALAVACVAGDGSGTVCGYTTGQGQYAKGSKASLKATARPGWEFKGWGEVVSGGRGATALPDGVVTNILSEKASWSVTLTNDAEIVALFGRIPYAAGLASPADGGKVTGSGYCAAGKKVTLKATANKNYTFTGWYTNNVLVSSLASLVLDRSAKPAKSDAKQTVITNVSESVTYYAMFKSDPEVFVTALCDDETGTELTGKGAGKFVAGTVTGVGKYAAGKNVTLKVTANKGYVFAGWCDGVEGSAAIDCDRLLSTAASHSFVMPSNDVELTAMFITSGFDKSNIVVTVNEMAFGEPIAGTGDACPYLATNVYVGTYVEWPVVASALSATTVKVSGLPTGLKFTDKPVTSKVTTGTGKEKKTMVVTNVPANTIYGTPTAASKADKKGIVQPSKVVVTVTTAGKNSQQFTINFTVLPLPTTCVGTFAGYALVQVNTNATPTAEDETGWISLPCPFTATVDAKGGLSGALTALGKKLSFKATGYASFDAVKTKLAYDVAIPLKTIDKTWTENLGVSLAVSSGVASQAPSSSASPHLAVTAIDARRNAAKDAGFADLAKSYAGTYVAAFDVPMPDGVTTGLVTVALTVDAKGSVKAAGTFVDAATFSASATLTIAEDGASAEVLVPVTGKSFGSGGAILAFGFEKGEDGTVAVASLTDEFGAPVSCAAKYVPATEKVAVTYAAYDLRENASYAYKANAWVGEALTKDDFLSVSYLDGETPVEALYAFTASKTGAITGVDKTTNKSKLTFKLDSKTGLFTGANGKTKVFGALYPAIGDDATVSGHGSAALSTGGVAPVSVGIFVNE